MKPSNSLNDDKFNQQEMEYKFPYHYIPQYTKNGINRTRELGFADEYLAYLKYVATKISNDKDINTVLDVGCGDGRLCDVLKRCTNVSRIKGIDLSEKAVMWGKLFNPDVEFEAIDVSNEKGKWDAITCVEVIEHIPDDMLRDFFKSCADRLQEGGNIFLTVPSVNLPLQKKHYRHYTEKLLSQQIADSSADLVISELEYIVPKKNWLDFLLQKILHNHIYKLSIYDQIAWNRIWRNGLVASDKKGTHIFAKIQKRTKK